MRTRLDRETVLDLAHARHRSEHRERLLALAGLGAALDPDDAVVGLDP